MEFSISDWPRLWNSWWSWPFSEATPFSFTVTKFLTGSIQLFDSFQIPVPVAIMWPTLSTYVKRRKFIAELAFRTGLVLLTCTLSVETIYWQNICNCHVCFPVAVGLAALIPKLDLFISLVGAFSSSFLALVFPPILEIITYWPKASKWLIAKDALIMLFGIIVFSTGTYSSIEAIVASFGQDDWITVQFFKTRSLNLWRAFVTPQI